MQKPKVAKPISRISSLELHPMTMDKIYEDENE